jgi:hypothetical protein
VRIVAHVTGMVDFAVEQLHLQDHALFLGMAQHHFYPLHAVPEAGFIVHSLAVSTETDQVFISGVRHEFNMFCVAFYQGWMVIHVVPSFGEADFGPVAHRRIDAVLFQYRPVGRTHQVNGGEPNLLNNPAQFAYFKKREGPAADRMVDVAL